MRQLLFAVLLAPALAAADNIEPGNWEFTVDVQAEGLGAFQPKPGPIVNTRCISAEQAANPAKVLGDEGARGDCQFSNQRDTGSEFTFDVQCTGRIPVHGSGKMRYSAQTLDGDLDLNGDAQGMQFKTRSHVNARRIGPCTS
ncbi:MAG TPA: DUF3617 family protein [Burkholderiales bacterium]|nr:DUF3617 family protein [Burkholderiales bacterium]